MGKKRKTPAVMCALLRSGRHGVGMALMARADLPADGPRGARRSAARDREGSRGMAEHG